MSSRDYKDQGKSLSEERDIPKEFGQVQTEGGGGGIRIVVGLLPEIRPGKKRWQERRAKFGEGFTWETGALAYIQGQQLSLALVVYQFKTMHKTYKSAFGCAQTNPR